MHQVPEEGGAGESYPPRQESVSWISSSVGRFFQVITLGRFWVIPEAVPMAARAVNGSLSYEFRDGF